MRETIIEFLLTRYLRTFPPISKNGNNAFGEFKRQVLMTVMSIVGGKNTFNIIEKITRRWVLTT